MHLAGVRHLDPGADLQQGALAGAVLPDDRVQLPLADRRARRGRGRARRARLRRTPSRRSSRGRGAPRAPYRGTVSHAEQTEARGGQPSRRAAVTGNRRRAGRSRSPAALGACIDGDGLDLGERPGRGRDDRPRGERPDPGRRRPPGGRGVQPRPRRAIRTTAAPADTICAALAAAAAASAQRRRRAGPTAAPPRVGRRTRSRRAASACTVGCAPGRADCNAALADGCEVTVLAHRSDAAAAPAGSPAAARPATPAPAPTACSSRTAEPSPRSPSTAPRSSPASTGAGPRGRRRSPRTAVSLPLLCHGAPSAGLALDPTGHVSFSDPAALRHRAGAGRRPGRSWRSPRRSTSSSDPARAHLRERPAGLGAGLQRPRTPWRRA